MVLVPEDVGSPAIAVSAREVSTCNLLENMCDMQGLQGSYFGDVSAIPVLQVLDKGRKRKGPLVGADCEEESTDVRHLLGRDSGAAKTSARRSYSPSVCSGSSHIV